MSIGFYLKDKTRKVSSITIHVAFKGKVFKRAAGESVPVDKWNFTTQRCSIIGFTSGRTINRNLSDLHHYTHQACDQFVDERRIPDAAEFWDRVDFIKSGGVVTTEVFFVDYLNTYIDRIKSIREPSTIRKFITLRNKLEEFQDENKIILKFDDIDMDFYTKFKGFIEVRNLSANYFGSLIKNLKKAYRESREVDRLHNLRGIDVKDFKVTQEEADSIYLNLEELLKIHGLEISRETILKTYPDTDLRPENLSRRIKSLSIARNKFLIGAFTALRVSDFNRLQDINLATGYVRIRTKKTNVPVVIPIHWVIREILDSGFDIQTPMSDQKLNKQIKVVARMAGITEAVEKSIRRGGRIVTEVSEKCELVTTHTCRRSGATNMVKFGISPLNVMKITGHRTWASFMKYIKTNAEENAELLKGTGFFDKPLPGKESGKETL